MDNPHIQGLLLRMRKKANQDITLPFHEADVILKALLESTASSIILIQDGRIRYANPVTSEYTGYTCTELQGMALAEIIHPDQRKQVEESVERRLAGDRSRDHTVFQIISRDGSVRWGDFIAIELTLEGRPALVATGHDITRFREAEEKLREEWSRLYTIFNSINELIYVADPYNHEILFANQTFRERIGRDPSGSICYEALHRRDSPCPYCTNEIILHNNYQVHQWEHYNSGMKRHYLIFDRLIKWPDGRDVRFEIAIDHTGYRQAREDLLREMERLSITLRSIADGVITTDAEEKVLLLNPAAERITGFGEKDAFGMPLDRVFSIASVQIRDVPLHPLTDINGQYAPMEFLDDIILRDRKGDEKLIEYSAAAIRDTEDNNIGYIIIFRDITEKKRIEEGMFKAQKLESIGILAGGIAHDFNNILTAIMGNISLAKMFANPDDKIYNRLSEAEKSFARATELTQQLLTFSRGGTPVKRALNTSDLLHRTSSFTLSGTDVSYDILVADDLWPIEADEGQMGQVISNLLLNAQQSMPERGKITVRAGNMPLDSIPPAVRRDIPGGTDRYVMISIKDHGSSISEDIIKNIFDPYFTTKPRGLGLGLATSFSIIKKHGGHITVESKPGEGTLFALYLPAAKTPPREEESTSAESHETKGTVLVMDDDENILTVAGSFLKHLGYSVEFARNGEEAMEAYMKNHREGRSYDAVIMDLTIRGGMGGRECLQKLIRIHPDIKAIVSSGYSNDPVMANFRKYGFRGMLSKPYNIDDMGRILSKVILSKD